MRNGSYSLAVRLPLNLQSIANSFISIVSQPSTSQQATTSKLPTLPQTTLSIPIKQDDYLHPIQNPITSIESNAKLANTPQLALTNDANALSINVQSFPIRPRNAPSPPKKQQRPTRESARIRQQQHASQSLEAQQTPARLDRRPLTRSPERQAAQIQGDQQDNAGQSSQESPSITRQNDTDSEPASPLFALGQPSPPHQERSTTPPIPSTVPQQLLDTSSTSQHVQPSLPSTTNNLDLLDQDDTFDNNYNGYEGSAEDTENEESRDSGLQGKAYTTKYQSPYIQHAYSVSKHLYFLEEGTSNL